MFSAKNREPFMAALAALNPNPKSELNYSTPFELLVAVMLSAQATDKGVNLATAKLFPVANTPQKILDLGLDGLIPYVQTINLYRTKAQHLIEACRILIDPVSPAKYPAPAMSSSVFRRRPQDGQCCHERRFRRAGHCCGHPHLPRLQPHRALRRGRTPRKWKKNCSKWCLKTICSMPTTGFCFLGAISAKRGIRNVSAVR